MNTAPTPTPDTRTPASLAELAAFAGQPCLSIYQQTHRHHPDNQQDSARFRHRVKVLETALRLQYPADAVKVYLTPFESLAQDPVFWNHTRDGLAGNPRVDDLLDDLGALAERMGAEVRVLPGQRMPCQTGAAASFRH